MFGNAQSTMKKVAAFALGAAVILGSAACGTTDETQTAAKDSQNATSIVDSVKKDDKIAAMLPQKIAESGKLTVGMEMTYAPAEFVAEDGKTPEGYDVDLAKALAKTLGVKADFISSSFDSIVPSVGSKYDLGITAMTITEEREDSVDFVSYYKAGSMWVVKKGNPDKVDARTCAARRSQCRWAPRRKRMPTRSRNSAPPMARPRSRSCRASSRPMPRPTS